MSRTENYISGIYINERVIPPQHKKPYFYLIDLNENFGVDFLGAFKIIPHIMTEDVVSFFKEYPETKNHKRISLTYFGKRENHPVQDPFYKAQYRVEQEPEIIGKSIFVLSDKPKAIMELPCLNIIGQDLSQTFNIHKVIIPENISAIINYGIQTRGQGQQNRFSL